MPPAIRMADRTRLLCKLREGAFLLTISRRQILEFLDNKRQATVEGRMDLNKTLPLLLV